MRLLLVDPTQLLLDGLSCMLDQEPNFEVVGCAKDGREAIELARSSSPDVILMEVGLPELNGIDATRRIRAELPGARIIALSDRSDDRAIDAMLSAGASGYVLKDCGEAEVARAIRAVGEGGTYLSAEVAQKVTRRGSSPAPADPVFAVLTPREREVVQLVAEGNTSKQIAKRLGIGATTVDTHRHNAMRKLQVETTADLVKAALRARLTSLDP